MYAADGDCICKICNCGKHKCPHKSHSVAGWGPEICSEYGGQYHARPSERPESCKPPYNPIISDCPLSTVTTNRADFIAHDVHPVSKREHQKYEPPCTPMNDQSVYRNEYKEHPHCANRMIKPPTTTQDNGKFESATTNRTTYVAHDVKPPELRSREQYKAPTEPFDATNTYRTDFVPYDQQKMSSCKPPVTSQKSDAPFNSVSEQRHSYVQHNVEPRQIAEKIPYVKSNEPFESMTTNRQDFVPMENCKSQMLRPPGHRVETDKPFASDTTNRTDYVAHPAQIPEKFEHEKYVKPEGQMDMRTTYNDNFINQPNCKSMPIKPPVTPGNSEPFSSETSYRQNYQNWNQPANIVQHREKYTPLTAPFDGQTTTGTSYVAHNIDKPQSCKPPITAMEKLPFDGQTTHRTDYVARCPNVCPAATLSTNPRSISPEGYCYNGEDDDGHIHFVKGSRGAGIPIVS